MVTNVPDDAMTRDFSALLERDRLIHLTLAAAIVIGFFLAYIKDHYPSPLSYFLFDIVLALALVFWLTARARRGRALLPDTPLTKVLVVFYALCLVYALASDTPLLIGLSALRGWCFFTLAFLLGYDVIVSGRQVRAYLLLIVTLAVLTSLYGLYQYTVGAERILPQDELVAERHPFATYVTPTGEVEFRIFSTFVSAAAFGTMMAYGSCLALTLAISPRTRRMLRVVLLLGIIPMMVALVLTGTRAAFVMVLIGLGVLWVYRRTLRIYILAAVLIGLGIRTGIVLTEGRAAARFATLFDPGLFLGRVSQPLRAGWEAIRESPWGHGLGQTGHGVPLFLGKWYPTFRPIFADGDFGRIMVEMGFIGLILLAVILGIALKAGARAVRDLSQTAERDIVLGIFAGTIMIGVGTFVGSPFLSIPHGMLWWFLLGGLYKLWALHRRRGHAFRYAPAQSQGVAALVVRARRAALSVRGERRRIVSEPR